MAKVTFEIEIEAEEVPQAYDMLRDIVEAFEFPVYEIGCKYGDASIETQIGGAPRRVVTLPPVKELGFDNPEPLGLTEFVAAMGLDDEEEEEDETDPCIILPGGVVELDNGLVYQVFSIDATGRVILDLLEELDEEDSFFCGPRLH